MKNIKLFNAEKYQSDSYQKVSENVYKVTSSIDNKFKPVNDSEILNATDWIRENGKSSIIRFRRGDIQHRTAIYSVLGRGV
jgi:hypothetical protein